MKKLLVCLILLTLPLFSCTQKKQYRNDCSVDELMAVVLAEIPVELGYVDLPQTHFLYYFEEEDLPSNRRVQQSALSENINEVGVFYTEDPNEQKQLREELTDYLEDLREEKSTFVASYAPTEVPKLTAAQVRTFGNYTVYAVLSPQDQSAVWQAVEALLSDA